MLFNLQKFISGLRLSGEARKARWVWGGSLVVFSLIFFGWLTILNYNLKPFSAVVIKEQSSPPSLGFIATSRLGLAQAVNLIKDVVQRPNIVEINIDSFRATPFVPVNGPSVEPNLFPVY